MVREIMKELIKITENENGIKVVSAKELYLNLGYDKTNYKRWYEKNIVKTVFAIEGLDYTLSVIKTETPNNGRPVQDFALTIDFAKRLSKLAMTKEGENVISYLIAYEANNEKTKIMEKSMNGISAKSEKISSKEIAEITGKKHSNVMVDCRKLDDVYEKIAQLRLQSGSYLDAQNQSRPMFTLSKMQTMDLMTGYSIELRIKVNRRWEELENNAPQLPQSYAQALIELAKTVEQQEKTALELKEATSTIEENKSKVVFAESVTGSGNSILIRQFAKDLCDDGFNIGQNRLFKWFRKHGYLMGDNSPYQNYMDMGLFEVVTRSIGSGSGTFTTKTTKITGKGAVYFTKKIIEL